MVETELEKVNKYTGTKIGFYKEWQASWKDPSQELLDKTLPIHLDKQQKLSHGKGAVTWITHFLHTDIFPAPSGRSMEKRLRFSAALKIKPPEGLTGKLLKSTRSEQTGGDQGQVTRRRFQTQLAAVRHSLCLQAGLQMNLFHLLSPMEFRYFQVTLLPSLSCKVSKFHYNVFMAKLFLFLQVGWKS